MVMASRKCKNDMKLIEGAYENLITNELEQSIKDASANGLVCRQDDIDNAESPSMLAEHVHRIIQNRLADENLTNEERADFVNRLIDFLHEDKQDKVADGKHMLSAVVSKQDNRRTQQNRG